jgi:hypothetical protein
MYVCMDVMEKVVCRDSLLVKDLYGATSGDIGDTGNAGNASDERKLLGPLLRRIDDVRNIRDTRLDTRSEGPLS